MFGYLFFFRTTDIFGIPLPSGHTNMIQMILTLKVKERYKLLTLSFLIKLDIQLVGLAFEVNTAHTNIETQSSDDAAQKHELETFGQLNFMDIMHYGFNYIGVLTGILKTILNLLNIPEQNRQFQVHTSVTEHSRTTLRYRSVTMPIPMEKL